MFTRRNLRPALEALEHRNLMAAVDAFADQGDSFPVTSTNPPVLSRLPGAQTPMGPCIFVPTEQPESPAEGTPEPVSDPAADPPVANVIGDIFGNYSHLTVSVVNGVLRIRGDAGNNFFRMFGGDGTYRIEPWMTKINGQVWLEGTTFIYSGVTQGIDIDLGEGDSEITLELADVRRVTIRMGAGNDKVYVHGPNTNQYGSSDPRYDSIYVIPTEPVPLAIAEDLFVDTGAGDDRFAGYANAGGDVTVRMGEGDDSFIVGPLYYETARPRQNRTVSAGGIRTIDLGAGQDVENIPEDIRFDSELYGKMPFVWGFLDYYRGLVERGENTPGVPQIIRAYSFENPGRVDAEGRLEIEFTFTPGFRRVIDRLIARGVTIDAYSVIGGFARAVISREDLKLFANLPEFLHANPVGYVFNPRPVQRWEYDWDYIRPGSAVEAEENAWGPRPVINPPEPPPVSDPPPIIGPVRIEDVVLRNPSEIESLLDSYYGRRFIGPRQLQPPDFYIVLASGIYD